MLEDGRMFRGWGLVVTGLGAPFGKGFMMVSWLNLCMD